MTNEAGKKILVIGIGAGNPEYVTIQAVNALNRVDVFFIIDKGKDKKGLIRIRKDICERYIKDREYRWVSVPDPVRAKSDPAYSTDVKAWRAKRADIFRSFIEDELEDGQCGAFLVWGDPCLYDGTLRILDDIQNDIRARGQAAFEVEVIPGISSMQALAAGHRIALNRIGEAVHVTTGRKLAKGLPDDADNVVVFLDADMDLAAVPGDTEIYWGAYLGTDDEVLVSGRLGDVRQDIERIRRAARSEKGWIMDTYLLRRFKPSKES